VSRSASLVVLGLAALTSALLAAWLTASGWLEPGTARLLATTTMIWEVPGFAAERLFLVYPHLWFLLALLLDGIGRATALPALTLIAALAGGTAASIWLATLRRHGWPWRWALLLTVAVFCHPFSLWILTRAGADSMGLVAASLLLALLARLVRLFEPRHIVLLALCLAIGLLLDPRWVFYALIAIPFLPFVVGRAWLDEAAIGLLVVALVPLAGALVFLAAVGWLFGEGPLLFLAELGSGSDVARPLGPAPGVSAVARLLLASLAAAPMLCLGWCRGLGRRAALLGVAALLPAAGLAASLATGAAWSAGDFLHVAIAGQVVGIALGRRLVGHRAMLLLVLLGHLGGWLAIGQLDDGRLVAWRDAFVSWVPGTAASSGASAGPRLDAEVGALAGFLAGGPATLVDDRGIHPLLTAQGGVGPLVLPPSPAFQAQLLLAEPTIAQIAMARPTASPIGVDRGGDRIARRHPKLWEGGLAHYRLVFDTGGWRVWRRVELLGDAAAPLGRCLSGGRVAITAPALRAVACPDHRTSDDAVFVGRVSG